MSKTEIRSLCAGVDLHKTQFTVCAVNEDGEILLESKYPTSTAGYEAFIKEMHTQEEKGYSIELAIDSTGKYKILQKSNGGEGIHSQGD